SRAFIGGPAEYPLEIGVGGWLSQGLALQLGGMDYAQMSGKNLTEPGESGIPYAELPHERTCWKTWVRAHPASARELVGPYRVGGWKNDGMGPVCCPSASHMRVGRPLRKLRLAVLLVATVRRGMGAPWKCRAEGSAQFRVLRPRGPSHTGVPNYH